MTFEISRLWDFAQRQKLNLNFCLKFCSTRFKSSFEGIDFNKAAFVTFQAPSKDAFWKWEFVFEISRTFGRISKAFAKLK